MVCHARDESTSSTPRFALPSTNSDAVSSALCSPRLPAPAQSSYRSPWYSRPCRGLSLHVLKTYRDLRRSCLRQTLDELEPLLRRSLAVPPWSRSLQLRGYKPNLRHVRDAHPRTQQELQAPYRISCAPSHPLTLRLGREREERKATGWRGVDVGLRSRNRFPTRTNEGPQRGRHR